MVDARTLSGNALADALRDSRATTWSRVEDLDPAQWQVPRQAGVNPVAWELAHVAWFAEFWILRGPHHVDANGRVQARHEARFAGADAHFDSSRLPHAERWEIALPSRGQLQDRLQAQLDACLAALPRGEDDAALYFHRLALFHEDMHAEALAWLRAALGHPAPAGGSLPRWGSCGTTTVGAGNVAIGWPPGRAGFAFDNECAAHPVVLADFEIDAAPVTAGEFARFVAAGGYDDAAWWPGDAGAWRAQSPWRHPRRWRPTADGSGGRGWELRWFDRWLPLDDEQPIVHVNAWEAQAYCLWAGRRLPTAAEWEHAAISTLPPAFRWGHSVWEWTADAFMPYAGFEPGPYRDYSAPWFGDHRELRGGSFATHRRMHDARYRNFFQPHRCDIFAGFRTVARSAATAGMRRARR